VVETKNNCAILRRGISEKSSDSVLCITVPFSSGLRPRPVK
jgi:hypothetical protein